MVALHILHFIGLDADMAELWRCKACGRVILVDLLHRWWDVRAPGDGGVAHTGMR